MPAGEHATPSVQSTCAPANVLVRACVHVGGGCQVVRCEQGVPPPHLGIAQLQESGLQRLDGEVQHDGLPDRDRSDVGVVVSGMAGDVRGAQRVHTSLGGQPAPAWQAGNVQSTKVWMYECTNV